MERIASLDLDRTSIRELPASIERLQGLVSLNLKNCKSLVYLPDSICNLLSLEWLTLRGCSKLSKLPEDLWCLKRLDIVETGLRGCGPEQQLITLGDLAQFRSTAPMINAMVPNNEQNEAVADVESCLPWRGDSEILTDPEDMESLHHRCELGWTDIEESSYVEEMWKRHSEEMRRRHSEEMEEMRRLHLEEMRQRHSEEMEEMRQEMRERHLEEGPLVKRQRHLEEGLLLLEEQHLEEGQGHRPLEEIKRRRLP
ncbi:hypothetical protein ACFX19_028735 [Malus domestica]